MSAMDVTTQDKDPPYTMNSTTDTAVYDPGIAQEDPTALAQMLKLTSRADISNNSLNQSFDTESINDIIDNLSLDRCEADDESDTDIDDKMDYGQDVDQVFEEIKESVSRNLERKDSGISNLSLSSSNSEGLVVRVSENFTSIPYGIQPKSVYEHGKKNTDIMGVSYNGRMRQFIILDSKGVTTWKRDAVDARVSRALSYPKYEYRLITHLVYARKYNCYFALAKDFSLKVMNRDFVETCSVSADLSSVLFMLFNPVRDELITGGVGGTKVWHFHQVAAKAFMELKPLANYRLTLRYELPNIGGSWVKRVDLDQHLEHLYCCSDTDLHVYDMQGKLLFKFLKAHTMTITGCRYSIASKVLVTSSVDTEVKIWSLNGGLVHTFRGHSRAVTHLLIHPDTSSIAITSSLDGTVRMWSLDTMDALYSLVVSSDGVLWMGLTDDNLLYISTARNISVWSLNYFYQFWSLARNMVTELGLVGCVGKTTRVVATGEDSSVRLFARSNQKNMSTVLPPPSISPLQKVLSVCYSREFNVVFMLVNPQEIWVYTTRTDPACRIAVWNIHKIQYVHMMNKTRGEQDNNQSIRPSSSSSALHGGQASHRATESGIGNEEITNCCCLCDLNASAMMWTDEGFCCPVRHSYLLLGMEDGRVLFMDPVVKGQKYMEFKASKDAIEDMEHDKRHNCLVTLCSLKELLQIQIWSLPDLSLIHEVYCDKDLTNYARINMSFLTGHKSGCVNFYPLVPAEDVGMFKAKAVPEFSEVVDIYKRPEHNEAIIALDACQTMKIFCSCSEEGAIKIWDEFRVLLTEIMLDSSLSAACFLNDMGDMVVGFKKHMFFIDHTKVCPHLTPPETEPDTFDKESFVYEDPAVMYEGVMANPDPIDLDNYLVPYELEFSKDFLEGKLQLDPMKTKKEVESEEESEFSMAPTEIYQSPPDTPKPLSDLDLTLGSEVTKYDLIKHMEKTLRILIEKANTPLYLPETPSEKEDNSVRDGTPGQKKNRRRRKRDTTLDFSDEESGKEEERLRETTLFDLPVFGKSPGPTPSPSTPSTPQSLSSVEVSEDEESEKVDIKEEQKAKQEAKLQAIVKSRVDEVMPPPPPKLPTVRRPAKDAWTLMLEAFAAPQKTRADKSKIVAAPVMKIGETKPEVEGLKFEPHTKFTFSEVKVDIKSILKEKRRAIQRKKEVDHSHVKQEVKETVREKPKREIIKKKPALVRKKPKPGQKVAQPTTVSAIEKLHQIETKDKKEEKEEPTLDQLTEDSKHEDDGTQDEVTTQEDDKSEIVSPDDKNKMEKISVERIVPGLPTLPDLPPKPDSTTRIKSSKGRRNLTFIGETVPSASTSGEVTQAQLSDGESELSGQSRQGLVSGRAPSSLRLTPDTEQTETKSISVNTSFSHHFIPHPPESPQLLDSYSFNPPNTPNTYDTASVTGVSPLPRSRPISVSEALSVVLPRAVPDDDDTDARSDMYGSDSGVDSEFVSVSQRGMFLTETEISELDEGEREDVTGPLLTGIERANIKKRPASSFVDRAEHVIDARRRQTRPHTAANDHFTAEDLQAAFNAALHKYQSLPGSPPSPDKLYRNDGTQFDENWHDRAIDRHMLLRMQKEIRQYNAAQKRQLLEQRQREKQKSLFGHAECGMSTADASRPVTSTYVLQQLERANTTVPIRSTTAVSSPLPQRPRPQTAHMGALRRQQQPPHPHRDKCDLGSETPFRLRMSPVPPPPMSRAWSDRRENADSARRIDPQMLDPRNPHALRPKSSRSIPSKCSRYILVSRPKDKDQAPIPSPLEEQLLFERFPNIGMKMLHELDGTIIRHRKATYGIEYSPYAPQMH